MKLKMQMESHSPNTNTAETDIAMAMYLSTMSSKKMGSASMAAALQRRSETSTQ